MTNGNKDKVEQKVDGRKLRRGIRGRYSRKSIEEVDTYERYAMLLMAIMEALEIPVYRYPKSNHVYSYRQKIAMLVLRQRLNLSYDQFNTDASAYKGFLRAIGIGHIPHGSTLCRFAQCVNHGDLERIIIAFSMFCGKKCILAADCTGFSNFIRSAHFVKRCKQLGLKKEPRSFTKASFVADVDTLLIVSARASADRKADIRFMPGHIADLKGLDASYVVADKGYDCEGLHLKVRSDLKCRLVSPCRESRGNRGFSTHGRYRNQMKEHLVEGSELKAIYNRRPLIETVNFMVKAHAGSHVLSKSNSTKTAQTLCKAIVHNCKLVVERRYHLSDEE